MKEQLQKIEQTLGTIDNIKSLQTDWTKNNRVGPMLIFIDSNKYVLHQSNDTSNIIEYKQKLFQKNKPGVISAPIEMIDKDYFVTKFIEGNPVTRENTSINELAELQARFNETLKTNLKLWDEKNQKIRNYLEITKLIDLRKLPKLEFTKFCFLHGDYSLVNLVKTENNLIILDLEYVMDGPVAFDLARPLLRICKSETEKEKYLETYFKDKPRIDKEEQKNGLGLFYLIQAAHRHDWGYTMEAQQSILHFKELFKL